MKRNLILFALLPLLAVFSARAQSQQEAMQQAMAALPNDPAVRIGHLDNGLTYYIRHNELPAQRAEFYLATNVGAIQEEPDQDGLAHFLEHMCFNGTEHFPDKGILDYLRSIGAEFGRNINASTGFEETQYMLNNIPVQRETVVDTCLMILCDYAHFVNNDPAEIDKERGVIIEERRQRRNAQWRTMERSLPYYFKGTKMENCTLIGRQESLETFKPESLVNFYRTWYHPDMQAVVVVGDVDVDRTEAKIKEIFSVIPKCENPKAKEHLRVPDNQEPIVGIITDPETTVPSFELIWKSEAMPEEYNATVIGQMQDIMKTLVDMVMSERFADIVSQPDSPFLAGNLGISSLIYEDIDAVMGDVSMKEGHILDGFKAFYTEIERMKRYGFADDEVARAKADIENILENAVKKAPTRRNPQYINPILRNFFDKEPILDPETELQLGKQILANINAQVRREQDYERKLAAARSRANIDALTGMRNKHAYVDLEAQIDREIQAGTSDPFALVIFDVNGLKDVNDTLGHQAGDKFLQDACSEICRLFKHSPVFRIGGDEFVAVARIVGYRAPEGAADAQVRHLALVEAHREIAVAVVLDDEVGRDLAGGA